MKLKKRKESDICCILSTNLMCWGFFYILNLFHILFYFLFFCFSFFFKFVCFFKHHVAPKDRF